MSQTQTNNVCTTQHLIAWVTVQKATTKMTNKKWIYRV